MAPITTVTGLSGEVRKYTPGDWHALFSDQRGLRQPIWVWENKLAQRIWGETLDCGPYAFADKPPWDGMILVGDRLDLLLQARLATSNDSSYAVDDLSCRSRTCDNHFSVEIDIGTDLTRNVLTEEVRDYYLSTYGEERSDGLPVDIKLCPEATLEAVADGSFEVQAQFASGMAVAWKLANGKIQKRVKKYVEQHGVSQMASAAARLTKLGDQRPGGFFQYICDHLTEDEFSWLWNEMERHEPGIDFEVEVECDDCGMKFEETLTLGNFIFPDLRRRQVG